MTHDLNGTWKVTWVPYGSDIDFALEPNFVPEGWLDARIPEDIHATLRRAGAIRGNTYDKREDEERWIEEVDWLYFRCFRGPDDCREPLRLAFDGLDTFCEIWLNGELLGCADNMFRPWRFDVTGRVLPGRLNRLVVRVLSAPAAVAGRSGDIFSITGSDRIFARKAQMSYGWDFCARCVTAGIWKDVRLESVPEWSMPEVYAFTDRLDPVRNGDFRHNPVVSEGPGSDRNHRDLVDLAGNVILEEFKRLHWVVVSHVKNCQVHARLGENRDHFRQNLEPIATICEDTEVVRH